MKKNFVLLFILIVSVSAKASEEISQMVFKGQASFTGFYTEVSSDWDGVGAIRYIPELSYERLVRDNISFIFDTSINLSSSENGHVEDSDSSKADLYRLKVQTQFSNSDLRLGLQKINFGPAILLRSLQWFDQVNTTDPLGLTDGVWGVRYRYFFRDNTNVWLWGLYGNDKLKGNELSRTSDKTAEYGGRVQYPLEVGEVAFTYHQRKSQGMGFTGIGLSKELSEKRYALDGRFNIEIGAWFELVSIDQGTKLSNNWHNSLLLGGDYTFSIGNGVHCILEHLHSGFSDSPLHVDESYNTTAVQINYPFGLLDSFSFMQNYSWEVDVSLSYLSWARTYDEYSINSGIFYSNSNQSNLTTSPLNGKGIQVVLVYNH